MADNGKEAVESCDVEHYLFDSVTKIAVRSDKILSATCPWEEVFSEDLIF